MGITWWSKKNIEVDGKKVTVKKEGGGWFSWRSEDGSFGTGQRSVDEVREDAQIAEALRSGK